MSSAPPACNLRLDISQGEAGTEGAWLIRLVLSDENPLYEDANFNGIDDVIERQKLGALLPAGAAIPTRQQLAKDWKDAQRAKAPPALFVNRPMPDRVAPAVPVKWGEGQMAGVKAAPQSVRRWVMI